MEIYECPDEITGDSQQLWIQNVFYATVDAALLGLKERFIEQKDLLVALSCLLPNGFDTCILMPNELLKEKLVTVATKLALNPDALIAEYTSFVSLMISLKPIYPNQHHGVTFFVLYNYMHSNQLSILYPELYMAYRHLSVVPISQAECERCFSKMKILKDRLANRLSDVHLNDRLLLSMEFDIMFNLKTEEIIQKYAASSSELTRVLYP